MDSTLLKGLTVLETVAASATPTGVSDLARALGLPKSNVHRTLQTLQGAGYVAARPGGYECTLKLFELGSALVDRLDLRTQAQPAMETLATTTRETVHLALLDGTEVIYLHKIESSEPVRAYSRIGGRAPAHCVASGKALLAYQPRASLDALPDHLDGHTERSHTSATAVRADLDEVRRRGYATNRGEWRARVGGIAAPVFGLDRVPVAAIGISGPLDRLDPDDQDGIREVREAARDASRALGCTAYDQRLHALEE